MTGREKKLMWGFGAALAVFVALFLSTAGAGWVKNLFAENQRLEERVEELENLIASRGSWQDRDAWLDEAVPHFASRQEASAALLEAVEIADDDSASEVSLKSRQLTEPASGSDDDGSESDNDYFEATSVKLEVEAPEAALYQWIHRLQQPDSFRGVTALTLERGENGALRAEMELTQFYLP